MNLGWACNYAGDVLDLTTLGLSVVLKSRAVRVFTFHSVIDSSLQTGGSSQDHSSHEPNVLRRFLEWMSENTEPLLSEEIPRTDGSIDRQRKSSLAALTFDDGFLDHYTTVFPLLQTYGMKATFFVPTGLIGREGGVTRSMVREMSDYGMPIGSHSVSHCKLSHCSPEQITRELRDSRYYLEDLTGRACTQIAYPYGQYNETVKEIAGETGYERAFASTPSTLLSERFAMPRISIPNTFRSWRYASALYDAGRWRRALGRSERFDRFVHADLGYNSERLNWPRSMR